MNNRTSPDKPLPTRTEAEGATVDLPEGLGFFSTGQVLGDRYEILEMLGRGGMGEVWRAFDLKLRVEVALKALREDLFQSEHRRELLRQEVRAAREVVSPNVCRIFDLIEIDGRELVSMEYVDGATLLGVLQERGPLELKEAQDIASQFLSGLEAIHKAGLVHRDVKPENIMLTRAGRVVVMDFGLARGPESGAGSVSGTPAYMAPEHAAGADVDARADVYSAGVVLAEMVSPEGIKSYESRQSVWEGVRSEPAQVPDSPWAPVIQRAVARDRERRQNSAHTLIRELEDVTLRVEGAEDLHPYPGLASFTEEDAEYFFGREAEVEQMWRKLEGPPRMLGIMGPSGAGKSSFIAAGLVAHAPAGWGIIRTTPGNAAISSLRRALVPELTGETELLQRLVDTDSDDDVVAAVSRWRGRRDRALLVADQFEELFTQNSVETQRRFADLLRRFALEANLHVLLSMRDDFASSCHAHESLRPIFDQLTVLDPPTGANLRRALVQPATKCGYRFEDDELVNEMMTEVEGERGALPLLAFAAARLWEKRDRETGLLTRQAYKDIGGVGGALARHAESTIDRIGVERIPIVRELFRNLVTAEGTRAVREWDELLSVFDRTCHPERSGLRGRGVEGSPQGRKRADVLNVSPKLGGSFDSLADSVAQDDGKRAAAEVLRELIDARLLTSYEVHEDEHEPIRRVEIIHESLLANWPRLVRWQTQDQEGAQLRDELRQSARAWDEHGRDDDRLWTGTAFREYQLWRERYPGGLTEIEEAFASAMTSLATRRRRRRRIAVAAAFAVLLAGLAVVGSFWRQAILEARRAEAANLVSLGQLELDSYPTATVAHAIASLELADSSSARHLALKALWKGPSAFVVTEDFVRGCRFSPDGQLLLQSRYLSAQKHDGNLSLIRVDGSELLLENAHPGASAVDLDGFSDGGHFVSLARGDSGIKIVVWSAPEGTPLAEATFEAAQSLQGVAIDDGSRRVVLVFREGESLSVDALAFDGKAQRLGALGLDFSATDFAMDATNGRWLAAVLGNEVVAFQIGEERIHSPRTLGRVHDVVDIAIDPRGRFVATADAKGEIRLWNLAEPSLFTAVEGPPEIRSLSVRADGLRLVAVAKRDEGWSTWVWDLSTDPPRWLRILSGGRARYPRVSRWNATGQQYAEFILDQFVLLGSVDALPDAEPLVLFRGDSGQVADCEFNPKGGWLATADVAGLALWPLSREHPIVIRRHEQPIRDLVFAPNGGWMVSSSLDGKVRLWPLEGAPPEGGRELAYGESLAVSPDGERLVVGRGGGGPAMLSPHGGPLKVLQGFTGQVVGVAFSSDGSLVAATGGLFDPTEQVIRVWKVDSGDEVAVLEVGEKTKPVSLQFTNDGRLLSMSESGLLRWDVNTGTRELVYEAKLSVFSSDARGRIVVVVESESSHILAPGSAILLNLDAGIATRLEDFGNDVISVALDPTGSLLVTGDEDGEVRVGSPNGRTPHLLLGHEGTVLAVAVDPLGRWIVSGGHDGTIRLWPMPDLSKPPLHTLPREELIAKLKTLTNLRVVRDPGSSTGWTLTHDPFPGWETVPTW